MPGFQSVQFGRIHLHTQQASRFKTRHLSVKLAVPLAPEHVTPVAMLPYLWMEGTEPSPTAKALIRRLEALYGAGLRTNIGKRGDMQVAEINAGIPQDAYFQSDRALLPAVLELASELLADPATDGDSFLSDHVAIEQALHEQRISRIYDDKISFALERCLEETCRGTSVGLPRLGLADEVREQTGHTLYQAHQRLLTNASVDIYMTGDLGSSDDLAEAVQSAFGGVFADGEARTRPLVAPLPKRDAEQRVVTDRQPLQQGKLNLSYRTGRSYREPIYPAMLVANGVLGGFPHSKLFQNVREKASLAYYAFSRVDALTGLLTIQTGIDVSHYEQALQIIRDQVAAIQAAEVTEEEIEFTKRGIVNQYRQALDQPATVAELHYTGVLAGEVRTVDQLVADIQSVSKDDLVAASQDWQPDTVYFLTSEGESAND